MRNVLLLLLVARCIETIYLCTWRMLVLIMSIVFTVWGSVGSVIEKTPVVWIYGFCMLRRRSVP